MKVFRILGRRAQLVNVGGEDKVVPAGTIFRANPKSPHMLRLLKIKPAVCREIGEEEIPDSIKNNEEIFVLLD